MKFSLFNVGDTESVVGLYRKVFAHAQGDTEGLVIADLVKNLIYTTSSQNLIGCIATEGGHILGCIFFSRFSLANDLVAFILSPVAISTERQGEGIGQRLIGYGLDHLASLKVDWVLTYGDPNFYCQVGFQQISEALIKAPFTLSQPHGWQAQSLSSVPLRATPGVTACVDALSDPRYW